MTAIKLKKYFNPLKETSIAPLIVFRIIFGALMLFGVCRFILLGWVDKLYITPKYYFGYLGFEWVKPLPDEWMYLPFILMLFASIGILIGFFYRFSASLFFLCFTYVELIDKSNYLNHYYFVSLMAFLMILVPANAYFSVDSRLFPKLKKNTTSKWHIDILKFQLAIVYIFAGIAKLNTDWLFKAQPLKTWLQAHHQIPFFGQLLKQEWLAFGFSWMGCFYDLFIVFFLLNNKFRPYAYFFVVFFHFITWYLFPIGVFPWVMIFSTLIFFSNQFHEKILFFLSRKRMEFTLSTPIKNRPITHIFIICYLGVQILIPVRYVLYKGDLFWHEQGFRFSWRVMLMHKEGYATYYLVDRKTNREIEIDHNDFLTPIQLDQTITQPDMILQYATIIHDFYDGKTLTFNGHSFKINDPKVSADIYISLNGRPSQLFVSKKHDLTKIPYDLRGRKWLEPFKK